MKIVDRKTFLALPANTLFSKWEPCWFDELSIKGNSIPYDFFVQPIADAVTHHTGIEFGDLCARAALNGESIAIDLECQYRDGCFDQDQMFAVWEPQDVLALIERLTACAHPVASQPEQGAKP